MKRYTGFNEDGSTQSQEEYLGSANYPMVIFAGLFSLIILLSIIF